MKVEIVHPAGLGPEVLAAWARLRAGHALYASPFFHPDFTEAVGAVRGDARVAIFRREGEIVGLWPHHRRPGGFVRPIGAPLCDWHGPLLIEGFGLGGGDLLAGLGAAAARLPSLADPTGAFAASVKGDSPAYVADLTQGYEAYAAWQGEAHCHHVKNLRRRERKIARELGPVRIEHVCCDPAVFDQLLVWKRAQYAATGKHDVLSPAWAQALLRGLWARKEADLRVELLAAFVGGRLIAAEIFLRAGPVLHSWFPAYDPTLAAYGPGHMVTDAALHAAPARGVRLVEFGAGHDAYKRAWANRTVSMLEAVVHAPDGLGRARAGLMAAWDGLERGGPLARLAGQLRRRLDQAVAAEVGWVRAWGGAARAAFARASSGAAPEA